MLNALAAFLILPGVVAIAVPFALVAGGQPLRQTRGYAAVLFIMGGLVLLWCVREFYVAGRGTLAPWAPPRHLVVSGPYRFSRNPMYIAVSVILAGWAVLYWSYALMVYLAVVGIAFHLRVLLGEEPALARSFGPTWESYRARTKRWLL